MPNYKIEGDINFYDSLYNSLDYDSDKEDNSKKQICEISGQELKDRFVTLECNHTFNYDALYTEICKQKFDFQTYTMDTLSKKDIQSIRDKKIEYFIKCPYCRNIQFTLLPYYDDLPFAKKYGVNTDDPDFKVTKTYSYNIPTNHTFTLYGYQFSKGTCCKTNLINGKNVPCWQKYTTPIIAPDNTTKELCTIHVRPEVKEFKLQIKKKIIEEKMLAKEQAKALKAKTLEEKKNKKAEKLNEKKATLLCTAILKTGLRKGETCGQKSSGEHTLCKRHSK
jgi:hypothetical protein